MALIEHAVDMLLKLDLGNPMILWIQMEQIQEALKAADVGLHRCPTSVAVR